MPEPHFKNLIQLHTVISNFMAKLVSEIIHNTLMHKNVGCGQCSIWAHPSENFFIYIAIVVVNIYLDAPCKIPTSITFAPWSQVFGWSLVAVGTPWGQKLIFPISFQW